MMDYPIYTFLFRLILPVILLRLFIKSIREPAYRQHLGERFGRVKPHQVNPVWLHAVSVGELQAAFDLVSHYHQAGHALLITTTTGAGRQTAEKLYGQIATVSYVPYDDPAFIHTFLAGYQPKIALIMETELWPNLIRGCKKRAIPVWVINGRLSAKSVLRYQKIPGTISSVLSDLSGIIAQSQSDFDRFVAIGARKEQLSISGNLKFDRKPDATQIQLGRQWKKQLGDSRLVIFASTREGEEALILDHVALLIDQKIDVLIVPRHPARFNDVARLIEEKGYGCLRRSENAFTAARPNTVWLGDTLGEMTAYYSLCDIAVIGGSWLPFGGQSPLEAMAVLKPVIMGPYTDHFLDVVREAKQDGAIFQYDTLSDALIAINSLLDQPQAYQKAVDAGQHYLKIHQGALQKTICQLPI